MRILIDGYNLLFQSPFVGRGRGKGWLERARKNLVVHLQTQIADDLLPKTVLVFDASQKGDLSADFRSAKGVTVLFSRLHAEADDFLEELIRSHSSPRSLTVVSSDHRIKKCANARRAKAITSEHFLEELDRGRWRSQILASEGQSSESSGLDEKDRLLTDEQVNFWLDEFGQ